MKGKIQLTNEVLIRHTEWHSPKNYKTVELYTKAVVWEKLLLVIEESRDNRRETMMFDLFEHDGINGTFSAAVAKYLQAQLIGKVTSILISEELSPQTRNCHYGLKITL